MPSKKPLPAILRVRRPKDTVDYAAPTWAALLARYDLTDLYARLRATPDEGPHGGWVAVAFWSALAQALMKDRIPAYGAPQRRGRKKRFEGRMVRFYQAQYAAAVRKLAADRGTSLRQVFKGLAGKTRYAAADRKLLPSPYRRLRKPRAFEDAFYEIPRAIREGKR